MSIELEDGEPKVEWEPKTNRWKGRLFGVIAFSFHNGLLNGTTLVS